MEQLELIATAAFGLEAVVARELEKLGYAKQKVEDGRVTFVADVEGIARANLWLRSADRVLLEVGDFVARDFGELFDGIRAIPWPEWLAADAAFPVRGKAVRSQLMSVRDCQSITKKAIVESMNERHARDWFDESGAEYQVDVSILKDRVTVALDTSGSGLHKRGYRTRGGVAPLRETLAAALVQLSYWNADRPFVDPFCGSGTIAVEAALLGRDMAPGMRRSFAAEQWPQVPAEAWTRAREEASDRLRPPTVHLLHGSDLDDRALDQARYHAAQAGVGEDIHFQRMDVAELRSKRSYGCVITNPPYGERLGDREQAEDLYRRLAAAIEPLDTWSTYVLASHPRFEQVFGRRATRRRKLYNGRIECTYYQYAGPRPPRRRPTPTAALAASKPSPGSRGDATREGIDGKGE